MNRIRRPYATLFLGAFLAGFAGPRSEAQELRPPDSSGFHPAETRLLFTPAAWPIDAGEGYVAVYELFFPFVGVGITDFFSLAGGISLIPGADHQFVMITPKLTPYATQQWALACGLTYIGETGNRGVGIIYADASFGSRSGSGTIGLGWGFSGDGISDRPVVLAGFLVPLGGGTALVSENWFPPNLDPAMLSLGMRFSSGRMSADLALLFPARWDNSGGLTFLPWLSFAYGF